MREKPRLPWRSQPLPPGCELALRGSEGLADSVAAVVDELPRLEIEADLRDCIFTPPLRARN